MLPSVPRFVRPAPATAEAARHDDPGARTGTLRMPPRIEPVRRVEPRPAYRDDRSPRFAAGHDRPPVATPQFEPRRVPAPESRPAFRQAPRPYAPPARTEWQRAPAPQPAPPPHSEEHRQSPAQQEHSGRVGSERFHHR
jgi:hypothetical protein